MSTTPAASTRTFTVALIGNPNTGKSTLFNALAGMQSRVGNFPGCTVEKKVGRVRWNGQPLDLVDLPGTYSLSPRTLDEMVSVDVLLGRRGEIGSVDAVVCIVDASNLERNLYLVSQVLDLGLPTVVVLNMWDLARTRGISIDAEQLSQRLGVPVIPCEAHRKRGLDEIKQVIIQTAEQHHRPELRLFPPEFYAEIEQLGRQLQQWNVSVTEPYLLERMLVDVGGHVESRYTKSAPGLPEYLRAARERLQQAGCRIPAVEARVRYGWARQVLDGVLERPAARVTTASDRIDRVLTHRFVGLLFFCALMFIVFQAIYSWAGPFMEMIEGFQEWTSKLVSNQVAPGILRSLLVDGVIAGVGGVIVFLPQIVFLFLFIAILEDCGYMARAAFLMDKLMTRLGLSGKSFVPLMSSFACAIPGVMATRVIENRRDRMVTILVAPLMSCSARLPVYVLLIAAFIPTTGYLGGLVGLQGVVMFCMYSIGALVAIPVAWLLKKTFFRGETPPFVMELPSYKWPSPGVVLSRVYDRAKAFVVRAGTLIFATSIIVWALAYFPENHDQEEQIQAQIEQITAKADAALGSLEEKNESLAESEAKLDLLQTVLDPNAADEQRDAAAQQAEELELDIARPPQALENMRRELEAQTAKLAELVAPWNEQLEPLEEEKRRISSRLMEESYLGKMGHAIEPAVRPLGWDWRIGVGAIASFPAREVIIATLGTIYSLGGDVDEEHEGLRGALRSSQWPDGRKVYNVPVALSIMVFFALCAQCAATLMVIKRETNSWVWPLFTFTYMTTLAYLGALITYQAGMALLGSPGI